MNPSIPLRRLSWRQGIASQGPRVLAEETPVALSYGNATHAVMMATPADLEDFAVGFSLTEGIVATAQDISEMEIRDAADGINLRIWLAEAAADAQSARRRRMLGAAGCGMCGLESLAEANRAVPVVGEGIVWRVDDIAAALAAMPSAQVLNQATRSVHAAAFWRPGEAILLREDVGRHNALDKLGGALARSGRRAAEGILLLSSRLSVELVQKAAMLGAPMLVAVSAPTALAVRVAQAAGITLVGIGRDDGFEVFTNPDRIRFAAKGARDVA